VGNLVLSSESRTSEEWRTWRSIAFSPALYVARQFRTTAVIGAEEEDGRRVDQPESIELKTFTSMSCVGSSG